MQVFILYICRKTALKMHPCICALFEMLLSENVQQWSAVLPKASALACAVASTKSSSNVSPKEAVLHCRLVQPGKKEGNASNTLPTAPSAAADTTADASEAAARSVTVNGGGGADTAGERLQRASRGLSPRSDINELLLAGGADTSVGQGQHEVGEQERDEAGEPSLLASSSRGRRLLSRIRRSAAQLPVRLQGQQVIHHQL